MNQARITFFDDQILDLNEGDSVDFTINDKARVTATLTADCLTVKNPGFPDNISSSAHWTPEPVYFKAIHVKIPGRTIPIATFNLAKPVFDDIWTLMDDTSFHPIHPRHPLSNIYHSLDGGDTYYCRFPLQTDIWESASMPDTLKKQAALAIFNYNTTILNKYPNFKRVFDFYGLKPQNLMPNSPVNDRDFGWWCIPERFISRWTSQDINRVRGWYGFGDIHSAAEGPSNCHYHHDAWFLLRYLVTGDLSSYLMGMILVRQKVAYGLINTEAPRSQCREKGMWRGEKGGYRRGDASPGAAPNKEFDLGLVIASILHPEDQLIAEGMNTRLDYLLNIDNPGVWNGAGGGRAIGHYLENLLDHYRANPNPAIVTKAESFINHVFAKNAANIGADALWFDNSIRRGFNAVWEEVLAHVYIGKWITQFNICTQHLPHLKLMVEWVLQNGGVYVDPAQKYYRVAFEISTTDPTQKTFKGDLSGAFWAQLKSLCGLWFGTQYDALLDAAVNNSCMSLSSTVRVDEPGLGPSSEKWWPILMHMVRG